MKNKHYRLALLCIMSGLCCTINAQNFSIYMNHGISMSSNNRDNFRDDSQLAGSLFNKIEKDIFASQHEFGANYFLGKGFYVEMGIQWRKMKFLYENNELRWPSEITGSGFVPDPSLPRSMRLELTDHGLGIPVRLKKSWNAGSWQPFIHGFMMPGFYLTTDRKIELDNGDPFSTRSASKVDSRFIFHVGIGAGCEYAFSRRIFMGMIASADRSNWRLIDDGYWDNNMVNASLSLSLRYQI